MSREYFERTNPVPEYVAFNEKRNQYCWQKYSNAAAPFNDRWESFCDGLECAKQQHSGMVAVPVDVWLELLNDGLVSVPEQPTEALSKAMQCKAAQEQQQ